MCCTFQIMCVTIDNWTSFFYFCQRKGFIFESVLLDEAAFYYPGSQTLVLTGITSSQESADNHFFFFFGDPGPDWASADGKQSGRRCTDLCCLRKRWHLVSVAAGQSQRAWIHHYSCSPTTPLSAWALANHKGCCHSNGQACWCPWGSLLDRIPRCPFLAKGWALSAKRLCVFAHT